MPRIAWRVLRIGLLLPALSTVACRQLDVRLEIQEANRAYRSQHYEVALNGYLAAQKLDASFVELDRMIAYSYIGLFKPEDATPANQQHADRAIESLKRYIEARPDDASARDTLVSLYLSADRTDQAITYFADYLKQNPGDLDAAKSIATLHAKAGNFVGATQWYRRITELDPRNPQAFYIFGVVLYEKVSKSPDPEESVNLQTIEQGKAALARALQLRADYFEALVYSNLLLREQAKREADPARQEELLAKADDFRNRAVAITQARKAAGQNS